MPSRPFVVREHVTVWQRLKRSIYPGRLRAFLALAATVIAVSAGGGCAAEEDASRTATTDATKTKHAIHVFARLPNGARIPMAFGPATELGDGMVSEDAKGDTPGALQPKSFDGVSSLAQPGVGPRAGSPSLQIGNPSAFWDSAWVLLLRVAYMCDPLDAQTSLASYYRQQGLWNPPGGSSGTWFTFPRPDVLPSPSSPTPLPPADQQSLRLSISKRKQSLVCIADRLAEIADMPGTLFLPSMTIPTGSGCSGTTEWMEHINEQLENGYEYNADEPKELQQAGCLFYAEWEIPPQSDADRFIVRDLAIHSLGVLAGLDVQMPGLARPAVAPDAPGGVDFDIQVMRTAARLLHDLIRRSVYSDMAAAEQKLSRALDPAKGSAAAWALGADQERFGSYAHAARVLLGRWEIGDTPASFNGHGDPQCNGIRALESLPAAFADLNTRAADYPISTQGEAAATALVERLGLVIPPCSFDALSMDAIRGTIADVAEAITQVNNGLSLVTGTSLREAYFDRLREWSDAEIRAALERARRTKLLMDGQALSAPPAECTTESWPMGVEDPSQTRPPEDLERVKHERIATLPSVIAAKAIAVPGGLPRSRLQTDPIARSAEMLLSSRCSVSTTGDAYWGISNRNTDIIPKVVLQDAFHIGQALGRGLARLRGEASAASLTESVSRANAAVAEVKAWAGSGWVKQPLFDGEECDPTLAGSAWRPGSLTTVVGGLDPTDVGLPPGASPQDMATGIAESFGVVYGKPWVAECAAGIRSDCPADIETSRVTRPEVTVQATTDWTPEGWPGRSFSLRFHWEDPESKGVPATLPHTNNHLNAIGGDRFYLVQTRGFGVGGKGRVLGPLSSKKNDTGASATGFVIAPMQRELLDVLLNIGRWVGDRPPAVGGRSSSRSNGYCVDGLARDVFVPLENEVTGDATAGVENSWQHYLSLARQAAEAADKLGNDLINQGFNIDVRKEAADEALAGICGEYGVSNKVTIDAQGNVKPSPSDASLNACLGEEAIDVAFLGSVLPPGVQENSQDLSVLQANAGVLHGDTVLKCNSTSPRHELCSKTAMTATKLGLLPAPVAPPGMYAEATYVLDLIQSLRKGDPLHGVPGFKSSQLREQLDKGQYVPAHVAGILAGLRMSVTLRDEWQVTYQGSVLMDSREGPHWPGCLVHGTCLSGSEDDNLRNQLLNDAFRIPMGASSGTSICPVSTVLGGCSGAEGPDAMWQELNILKLRVQAAVNLLAASTGSAPGGLFRLPVPVVLASGAGPELNREVMYTGTVMTVGDPTDLQKYRFTNSSTEYIERIGDLWSAPSRFFAWPPSASHEVPDWYLDIYRLSPDRVLHADVSTGPMSYAHTSVGSDGRVTPWRRRGAEKEDWGARPLPLGVMFERNVGVLDGGRCFNAYGSMPGRNLREQLGDENFHRFIFEAQTSSFPWLVPAFWPSESLRKAGEPSAFFPDYAEWDTQAWALPPSARFLNFEFGSGSGRPIPRKTNVGVMNGSSGYSPADVVGYFLPTAPNGECGSLTHLLGGVAIIEAAGTLPLAGSDSLEPPPIRSIEDLAALEGWVAMAAERSKVLGSQMYVTNIPKRVVASLMNNGAVPGSQAGEIGVAMRDFADGLTSLHTNWTQMSSELKQISLVLEAARIGLEGADIRRDAAATELALRQLAAERDLAQGVQSMLAAAGSMFSPTSSGGISPANIFFGAAQVAAAAVGVSKSVDILNTLPQVGVNDDREQANQVRNVLNQLQTESSKHWTNFASLMDGFRIGVNRCIDASEKIKLLQRNAQYQVAKATLADFSGDVALPVNTVLRRQLGGTRIRYDRALLNAKALAYLARRSIEQRFGTPLSAIASSVGPLEAPASWADDVCSASGVNYATLRTAKQNGNAEAQDTRAISQYADAWIGDYVTKLERFVDYYNVEFPLHEADDTAVLSLRHDLMPAISECQSPSRNLLLYSGRLNEDPGLPFRGVASMPDDGWAHSGHTESDTHHLVPLSGTLLAAPRFGPSGAPPTSADGFIDESTGVSWLVELPADASIETSESLVPPGMVYQRVNLEPGEHLLSWWDQARTAAGSFLAPGSEPIPYAVRVHDSAGREVASFVGAPFVPADTDPTGKLWSDRRVIGFRVPAPGTYYVAFGASTNGTLGGSVAIANTQLEAVTGSAEPSPYVANGSVRTTVTAQCPPTEEAFRAAFVRRCADDGRCYRELEAPLTIDTVALNKQASSHLGTLARGNYNYRHINFAVNLVGTGIRSCGPDAPSTCYTSAYLEYDLSHDGTDAQLVDHAGTPRYFDFGIGHIRHGKALTAERLITVPLSTNDQSLINQPGISHSEFRGRPVDGRYQFRIWESPGFEWEKVQDVQLVMQYRYWSAVTANGNQP